MSIALVVTRGYGNGTLVGTIKDVVTRGYTSGTAVAIWTNITPVSTSWTETTPASTVWTEV